MQNELHHTQCFSVVLFAAPSLKAMLAGMLVVVVFVFFGQGLLSLIPNFVLEEAAAL